MYLQDGLPMFKDNTPADDVAILENLIAQIRDAVPDWSSLSANITSYDAAIRTDWGVEDVLAYIHAKYDPIWSQRPLKEF